MPDPTSPILFVPVAHLLEDHHQNAMLPVVMEYQELSIPIKELPHGGAGNAASSILKTPGAWWTALYDGFSKKKNGCRSVVLICASLINIVAVLAISSLSSAFLFSQEIIVSESVDFARLEPVAGSPLPIDVDRSTHFRTIASLLQNASTSPWITNDFTIFPFWPAEIGSPPVTSLPTEATQRWTAETMMFKSDLDCTPMALERKADETIIYPDQNLVRSNSTIWSSPDGCRWGMAAPSTFWSTGGASWSDASTFYYAEEALTTTKLTFSSSNHTAQCNGRQVILVTESWQNENPAFSAQVCNTTYFMAPITVTVALTGDVPDISFDASEFEQKKIIIADSVMDTTTILESTLDHKWPTYMLSVLQSSLVGGPSVLLGALYDYNMTAMARDPAWAKSAATANQRYFGEVLQAALTQQGASRPVPIKGTTVKVETRILVQKGPAVALGVLFAVSCLLLMILWWRSQCRYRPLNLRESPASVLGVAALIARNDRVDSGFQIFRQPTAKDLRERLDGQRFHTTSCGLSRSVPSQSLNGNVTQSENGTPKVLRIPFLVAFVLALLVVVASVGILWYFAMSVGLYEKVFVYQMQWSFLSDSMSSIAPISIVPTLIATLIGLWWGSIDETFRRLQPYVAMADGAPSVSRGPGLSYESSFWLWACLRAARNKHWLLALVTLGSSLVPVFTITMSALFNREPGVVTKPITFDRALEIRDIPHVFSTQQAVYPDTSNDYAAYILTDLYKNISTQWMYTATIQLTLNGSEPAWSKEGWSFVPIEMQSLSNVRVPGNLDESDNIGTYTQTNITLTTPAMRARIECSHYPAEALMNLSHWLSPVDLSNATVWNQTTIPHDIQGGFELGTHWIYNKNPGVILPLSGNETIATCDGCTTVFVNPGSIACCGNSSSTTWDPTVAVGYWSPNTNLSSWSTKSWHRNFTLKWIHGTAVTGIYKNPTKMQGNFSEPLPLLFPSPPSINLMNCRPLVESADAEVIVDPVNGVVQAFNVTSKPKELTEAFADNFLPHNGSYFQGERGYAYYNVTISLGRLFMASMLTAADTLEIGGAQHIGGYHSENLNDNTYNIRDEIKGLNLDFMSYAMYTMAGKNPKALLDPDLYLSLAQKTFTTFFQHYISNNISMETGGWGYQTINASLPDSLGPIVEVVNNWLPGNKPTIYQDEMHPISTTNRTVIAQISKRVEILQMNALAVWLSVGIMAWLVTITLLVIVLQRRYFSRLVRNVESLGDVLVLIAGSTNLLQVAREIQTGQLSPGQYEDLRTRLGWFMDKDGALRWGVEMVETVGDGPVVEWISSPYFSKKGTNTWGLSDESVQS
ncbi:hypothetical protein POX_b02602 [Penicillium oxalicum]|uniref:hypothetical protein n=1 Tax=Penicillium oxalicum TaxID=69781 RepID=UPI0020B8720B|nr:hypothetical protein POX_b02602 [Penicillium oxalicum]KAI2792564.1 hypothetical protein POX_b02602 [Penicillium oxalicum]